MEPFKQHLLTSLQRRRDEIRGIVQRPMSDANPVAVDLPPDHGQMMQGFFSLVEEALTSGERAVRDEHNQTLLPALKQSGLPLGVVVQGAVRLFVHMSALFLFDVPPADQLRATLWLSDF